MDLDLVTRRVREEFREMPGLRLTPAQAICMATGNTARAYDLPTGMISPGRAADLVLLDAPLGSYAENTLDAFALGDSPAVAMVMIDGEIVVARSRNTVPPQRAYRVLCVA